VPGLGTALNVGLEVYLINAVTIAAGVGMEPECHGYDACLSKNWTNSGFRRYVSFRCKISAELVLEAVGRLEKLKPAGGIGLNQRPGKGRTVDSQACKAQGMLPRALSPAARRVFCGTSFRSN
jgi:hypothetical protein